MENHYSKRKIIITCNNDKIILAEHFQLSPLLLEKLLKAKHGLTLNALVDAFTKGSKSSLLLHNGLLLLK
jgi:hypothetical protein